MTDPDGRSDIRPPSLRARPALPQGPFLIAGLGRAGRAAVHALSRAVGPQLVRAWDADTSAPMQRLRSELEAAGIRTDLGPWLTGQELGWARTLVKSPGIPFDSPAIRWAVAHRHEVMDELELGWRLSGAPVVAVTGTNGKSTVAGLVTSVLSAAGQRVRLAGNTEFGPCMSTVASASLDWIVCEVSSFQLEGCSRMLPELGVFTNLTPEHLGRHQTLRQYGAIKRRLFMNRHSSVTRAIVDVDGRFGRELASEIERRGGLVVRVGFGALADYRIESATWNLRRAQVVIRTPVDAVSLATRLPGAYNARNVAAALAVADLIGVDRPISAEALGTHPGLPGRFEHIDAGQAFDVVVDFAHTVDALDQLLRTVRAGLTPGGRLTVVFGLGGAPSAAFRAMGRVANQLSDRLILTTSGFRGSPPILGLGSLLAGARMAGDAEPEVVLNRRRAIQRSVLTAQPGDAIVIPGRGAFTDMRADARGKLIPFDDRRVALEILQSAERAVVPQSLTATPRRFSTPRRPSSAE